MKRRVSILFIIAAAFLFIVVGGTIFAGHIATHDPDEMDIINKLSGITAQHILGTDKVGRDIFSRALYGGRTTILSAFAVVALSVILGVPVGLYAGYYGGKLDRIVSSVWNVILSFPSMLVAFVLMTVIGKGIEAGIIALGIIYTPMISRLARSLVIVEKNKNYVDAEKVLGASDARIIFVHILPNVVSELIAELTLDIAYAILDLASLSFIGLGVQPPQSDWGYMLSDAQQFITISPIQALVPGFLIIVSVVSLNVVSTEITDMIESGRYSLSVTGKKSTRGKKERSGFIYGYLKHAYGTETEHLEGKRRWKVRAFSK